VNGTLRIMKHLGMLRGVRTRRGVDSVETADTHWLRARQSGILHLEVTPGDWVHRNQKLGAIADPLGETNVVLRAPGEGLVIGQTTNPLVHRGDAILHLAQGPKPA